MYIYPFMEIKIQFKGKGDVSLILSFDLLLNVGSRLWLHTSIVFQHDRGVPQARCSTSMIEVFPERSRGENISPKTRSIVDQ